MEHPKVCALSDEIWTLVSGLLPALDLMALYLCGSSVLCARLSRAVETFHSVRTSDRALSWPKCFKRFPALRNVFLGYPALQDRPNYVQGVDLTVLPPSLEKLTLKFDNAFACLLDPLLTPDNDDIVHPRLMKGLPTMFPRLNTLYWQTLSNEDTNSWSFREFFEDLAMLPHLRDIGDPDHLKQHWSWSEFAAIPTTIQRLNMVNLKLHNFSECLFPPTLTSFTFLYPHKCDVNQLLSKLPQSMTTLNLYTTGIETSELAPLLSLTHLTSLRISLAKFDTTFAKNLPTSLTYLVASAQGLDIESLAFLPRRLTSLLLDTRRIYSPVPTANVPEHGLQVSTLDSVSTQLPLSITRMSRSLFDIFSPKQWKNLPKGMDLTLTPRDKKLLQIGSGDAEEHLMHLPTALQALKLVSFSPGSVKMIPSAAYLAKLQLVFQNQEEDAKALLAEISNVCRNLAKLEVSSSVALNSNSFDSFRCGLRKLTLSGTFGREDPGQETTSPDLLVNLFKLTPSFGLLDTRHHWYRHLEKLDLEEAVFPQLVLPVTWFDSLPRTLTLLRLGYKADSKGPCLPTEVLAHLPPRLLVLCLTISAVDSNYFARLPRTLESLSIGGPESDWKLEQVTDMPKSIRKLELPPIAPCERVQTNGGWLEKTKTGLREKLPNLTSFTTSISPQGPVSFC